MEKGIDAFEEQGEFHRLKRKQRSTKSTETEKNNNEKTYVRIRQLKYFGTKLGRKEKKNDQEVNNDVDSEQAKKWTGLSLDGCTVNMKRGAKLEDHCS